MENQHRMIKTYRDLDSAEIALMNECKEMEAQVLDLLSRVNANLVAQRDAACETLRAAASSPEEDNAAQEVLTRHADTEPLRWIELARADIQVGFMKLTRSVAQPIPFSIAKLNQPK